MSLDRMTESSGQLKCEIHSTRPDLKGRINERLGRLKCEIRSTRPELKGRITINRGSSSPIYDGPTRVKPRPFEEQVLETQDKLMLDDVTVLAIPYFETSNPSDGLTVYIGE